MPEGLLFLEDKIKKEIEAKIKRGRVTCVVTITGSKAPKVFVNKKLLQGYVAKLKNLKKEFQLEDGLRLDTLIHLPGVLSLEEDKIPKEIIWLRLKTVLHGAIDHLVKMRLREGKATYFYLNNRAKTLSQLLGQAKARFKKAIKEKIRSISTDEERSNFLKDADITEEIERLSFHIRSLKNKLSKAGPIGKELDFIAQEMQREVNTMAAKSLEAVISAKAVQMKGQIEKIREQAQNIE
jgi:uncharacterized protein (TIGR00255 family)